MAPGCPGCGCSDPAGAPAHRLQAALADDDLDGAMRLGLLEAGNVCPTCSDTCRATLAAARDARHQALAARERFRARAARLARRERERAARRKPVPAPDATDSPTPATPSLPPAAAAALARAKARAAGRKP